MPVPKSAKLIKGLRKLDGKVYISSAFINLVPNYLNLKGLVTTYISELHRIIRDNFRLPKHVYDKREVFTLSDGG